MNPLLLTSLFSILGPQLLGRLFGGGDPQARLRAEISRILSPESIAARTNTLQNEYYKSPTYTSAQNSSLATGRMAEADVGRAGAGVTSGLDLIKGAVSAGVGPAALTKFNADMYGANSQLAQQGAYAQAQGLMGIGPSPNYGRELFGASMSSLGPLIASWLKHKYGWS